MPHDSPAPRSTTSSSQEQHHFLAAPHSLFNSPTVARAALLPSGRATGFSSFRCDSRSVVMSEPHSASPTSSSPEGYIAVPLAHRHNNSQLNSTNSLALAGSSPSVAAPPLSSTITVAQSQQSAAEQQRALRWQALGVNVGAITGCRSPTPIVCPQQAINDQAPPLSSPSVAAHRQLVALSRTIEEAKQEHHFELTVQKGGVGGRSAGPSWARKQFLQKKCPAERQNQVGNDEGPHSRKRRRSDEAPSVEEASHVREPPQMDVQGGESLDDILAHLESAGGADLRRGQSSSARTAPATTKGKKAPPSQRSKRRGGQVDPDAAPMAAGGSTAKRTLFKIGTPSTAHHGVASSSTTPSTLLSSAACTKMLHDKSVSDLIDEIDGELNDVNRIQSLLIGIVVVTTDGQNSFSLASMGSSAGSSGLTCGPMVAHRKRLLEALGGFLVLWKEDVILLPPQDGIELLCSLDRNGPRGATDVDIVMWDASSVLIPLMAHQFSTAAQRQAASPPYPLDVRIMGWMLDPSEPWSDFDALHLRHLPSARLSQFPMNTIEGACDRAVQLMVLYRRLYAALGSKGLLQPLLKQERPTAFICAMMKFDGFLVDVSQMQILKARAKEVSAALQDEALALVLPHMSQFNLQSPDDCREALYGVLNLGRYLADASSIGTSSADVTTKGGKMSTAEDVLRRLAPHNRLPQVILEHRKISKIVQTYLEGILESNAVPLGDDDRFCAEVGYAPYERESIDEFLIHSGESPALHRHSTSLSRRENLRRVHATFLQYGTDTGRLSCVEPNLQNLPRIGCGMDDDNNNNTPLGGGGGAAAAATSIGNLLTTSVRKAFVPLPGCDLVAFDYEQIELRVLAHLSNDAQLVEALGGCASITSAPHSAIAPTGNDSTAEIDIHRRIASVIFRKAEVSKEERSLAKRVVFGVLYGMGPRALAAQLNESYERAVYIQDAFKNGFPHLERYQARVVAQCRQDGGIVRTLCGRLRTLSDITDSNHTKRSLAERQAFNTVIQGSAADIVKRAMAAVYEQVLQDAEFGGRIRLHCQVHDELVFSIPRSMLHAAVRRIQSAMSSCVLLSVPLRVAVQVGPSYGELQAYKHPEEGKGTEQLPVQQQGRAGS